MHCAEALDIPLTIAFTMPWVKSKAFPHPMFSDRGWGSKHWNKMSFDLIDGSTWLGCGDIINKFRQKELKLNPVPFFDGANLAYEREIPHIFCYRCTHYIVGVLLRHDSHCCQRGAVPAPRRLAGSSRADQLLVSAREHIQLHAASRSCAVYIIRPGAHLCGVWQHLNQERGGFHEDDCNGGREGGGAAADIVRLGRHGQATEH